MTGHRAAGDRATGTVGTAAGVLVLLAFLLLAVQLLFALYASSTVTAVTQDAAQRAALEGSPLADVEADARARLGRVGRTAAFTWSTADEDGDGTSDTVVLQVRVQPPRFVPPSIGDGVGLGTIERTARARIEEPRR